MLVETIAITSGLFLLLVYVSLYRKWREYRNMIEIMSEVMSEMQRELKSKEIKILRLKRLKNGRK